MRQFELRGASSKDYRMLLASLCGYGGPSAPNKSCVLLSNLIHHHKVFRLIEIFKYYYLQLYDQTSRLIDKSRQRT
jgi:hypothetical protein